MSAVPNTPPDPRRFKTIALVGRYQTAGVAQTLLEISQFLSQRGCDVVLESETAAAISRTDLRHGPPAELGQTADLAVVVGGDGTMLGIARELAPYDIPMVGINHGRLGFMTDIALSRWNDVLVDVLAGRYVSEERTMLNARVMRGDAVIFSALALNDVVVARGASGRMVELQVHVDGQYMYTQRADGLILATPTGSTAYALSSAGPILYPSIAGIVLVPVAPQALSNRPIVLPDHCTVSIRVSEARDSRVNCDMQTFTALETGDEIVVQRAPHRTEFLHPAGYSYFGTLRQKLNWHAIPMDWNSLPSLSEPTS